MTELSWRVMNGHVWDGLTKRRWCEHGGCRCLCLWWVWEQKEGEVWWNAPWRFPLEWAWSLVELWKQLLLPVRLHFHMRLFGLCRWGGTPYLYIWLIFRARDWWVLKVFPSEVSSRHIGRHRSVERLLWIGKDLIVSSTYIEYYIAHKCVFQCFINGLSRICKGLSIELISGFG